MVLVVRVRWARGLPRRSFIDCCIGWMNGMEHERDCEWSHVVQDKSEVVGEYHTRQIVRATTLQAAKEKQLAYDLDFIQWQELPVR